MNGLIHILNKEKKIVEIGVRLDPPQIRPKYFRNDYFSSFTEPKLKVIKWPYLGTCALNQKNKGTLLSPTLKVEESKVPLFF